MKSRSLLIQVAPCSTATAAWPASATRLAVAAPARHNSSTTTQWRGPATRVRTPGLPRRAATWSRAVAKGVGGVEHPPVGEDTDRADAHDVADAQRLPVGHGTREPGPHLLVVSGLPTERGNQDVDVNDQHPSPSRPAARNCRPGRRRGVSGRPRRPRPGARGWSQCVLAVPVPLPRPVPETPSRYRRPLPRRAGPSTADRRWTCGAPMTAPNVHRGAAVSRRSDVRRAGEDGVARARCDLRRGSA